MRKSLWYRVPLSLIAVAALAAAVAVTASGGTSAKKASKTLNLSAAQTDVDYTDPALAYGVLSWQIEYETCSKLLDYADGSSELTPDAAAGLPVVSANGKTYTFTIKSGIKFNDGSALTANSFVAAFNRDANPSMNSPVNAFMTDVVGYDNVVNKKASKVSGVTASGNKLTIKLTQADGGLLDKLAMPFFCAIEPSKTPVNPQGVNTLPGSGPYYIADRTVGKQIVLKRNPYYKGPRLHRSDTIVFTMNTDSQQTYLQVSNGTYAADATGLTNPAAAADLQKQYGVNKSRFFVNPTPETDYIALNTQGSAFKSAAVRRAVNYAIDRPALLRVRGVLGGSRTDDDPAVVPHGRRLRPEAVPDRRCAVGKGQVARRSVLAATSTSGTRRAPWARRRRGSSSTTSTRWAATRRRSRSSVSRSTRRPASRVLPST